MNILLVEDEPKMAAFIKDALTEDHYTVDVVGDGNEALTQAAINSYNLFILDIMLPRKDGLTVCRELREKKIDTPILLLTAKSKLRDKVRGLDLGADDYLAKPFEIEELLARVRALLRREKKTNHPFCKLPISFLTRLPGRLRARVNPLNLLQRNTRYYVTS
jgi:DNA-binding response OmpR family regulator